MIADLKREMKMEKHLHHHKDPNWDRRLMRTFSAISSVTKFVLSAPTVVD